MESLEGKKGQPRYKPPFPANFGLYGKPTTINNTETYASVPAIIRNGAEWFLNLGKPNNGGPKIFSVSGHVDKPGQLRDPPRHAVRRPAARWPAACAAAASSRRVIPGGSSMPVLPGETMMACTMDYDSIQKAGSGLGSGAVIVMDDTTCMVRACQRIARFYYSRKLRPVHAVPRRHRLDVPHAHPHRRRQGRRWTTCTCCKAAAGQIEGHTICAFGEAAAWPVQGFLRHYWDEFEYAIVQQAFPGRRPAAGTVVEEAAA